MADWRHSIVTLPWVAIIKVVLGSLAAAGAAGILPTDGQLMAAVLAAYAALSGGREITRNGS